MRRPALCKSNEHVVSRRAMLAGLLGGAAGVGAAFNTALAEELKAKRKRLLLIFHNGGMSQLESWDPKPGTLNGGPFQAIGTSVPGIQVSETLPLTARQMHHMALFRGLSTGENNHGPGQYLMSTGRRETAALKYPHLGCVVHQRHTPADHPVPGFVSVGGGANPAFLGPQFGPVEVKAGELPGNLDPPESFKEGFAAFDDRRRALRRRLDQRFQKRRGTAETAVYSESFEQAMKIVHSRKLFDLEQESAADRQRYGDHSLGRSLLLARRLLEHDATCVTVGHGGYDTHAEHFNVSLDLHEQFDRPFACVIEDLAARGMLEDTLVVSMGEFGRTPRVNYRMGRDHWSGAWSIALAGVGLPRGAAVGKTNKNGTAVSDVKAHSGDLFHTLLTALGIDSTEHWVVDGQQVPVADPAGKPIKELLA